jgi:hypothetical protein
MARNQQNQESGDRLMRSGQQKQRGRGRNNGGGGNNNNNRKGGNPLSRSYDSTGPDVKVRGTAQQIAEKYMNLARDAQSVGDNVMAENYLQHAEHYNRIIAAAQAQMQERYQRNDRDNNERDHGGERDHGEREGAEREMSDQDGQDDRQERRENAIHANGSRVEEASTHRQGRRDDRPAREDRPARDERPANEEERNAPAPNGFGPQPTIEGTPAEVAMEEEDAGAGGGRRATTRRRSAAARPRRTRAKADTAGETEAGEAAPAEGKNESVAVAGE